MNAQDQWLLGVASVLFDIDQGQTLEHVYPEDALTPEESKAIAFHSKPFEAPLNPQLLSPG